MCLWFIGCDIPLRFNKTKLKKEWHLTRVCLLWPNVSFTHFETWLDYHAGVLDFF